MSEETKIKLVYSGELMIFAIAFLVLGILKITGVMGYDATRRTVFNYITICGGTWILVDLIWTIVSKKKRAKNCLLDKILNAPLGIYLITFDIICFAKPEMDTSFYVYGIGVVFFYITVNYGFQSVYHFFHPLPSLMEEIEKAKQAEQEQELEETKEIITDEEKPTEQ